MESLDQKIEQAKQKVIKTNAAHEKAVDELQILLDKKKTLQTDELMQAISKSEKTFEEIMRFIEKGWYAMKKYTFKVYLAGRGKEVYRVIEMTVYPQI